MLNAYCVALDATTSDQFVPSSGDTTSEGEGDESESEESDSGLNSFEKEVKDAMDKMKEENESKSDESSDEKF